MKRGRRLSGCAKSSGRVTERGLGGLAVHGIIPTVVATLNMKGAIQWWAATSAMVGLSEGSVASKQDNNCRKPGENWAGNGEVTPETIFFLQYKRKTGHLGLFSLSEQGVWEPQRLFCKRRVRRGYIRATKCRTWVVFFIGENLGGFLLEKASSVVDIEKSLTTFLTHLVLYGRPSHSSGEM